MSKYKTQLFFIGTIIILNATFYFVGSMENKGKKDNLILSYKIGYFEGANAVTETLNEGVKWDEEIGNLTFKLDSTMFSNRFCKDR